MSTDLVYVTETTAPALTKALISRLQSTTEKPRLITPASKTRLNGLLADARSKGATIHQLYPVNDSASEFPPTIIENLTPDMAFYTTESFGPILGIIRSPSESHAMDLTKQATYGLSAAIFTTSHFRALKLAGEMRVGAVHVNSMTVHDEPTLPHGGVGESGFGRFGAKWGIEEFLETRTVVLNP